MKSKLLLAVTVSALIGLPDLRFRAEAVEFTRIPLEQIAVRSAGCAWGDYNNDGFPDLFITKGTWFSSAAACVLHRNNRDGTFTKVTSAEAGEIASQARHWYFAAWGDYDNDGWLDLFVTDDTWDSHTTLWRNTGEGRFIDVSAGSPFREDRLYQAPIWGDFNGDGFLDLFVTGFYDDPPEYPNYGRNHLYLSRGDGTFQEITDSDLIRHRYITEGGAAADFDGDGDLDILVTGQVAPAIFENDGHGNFRKLRTGPGVPAMSITAAWGDFNNDGRLDIVVVSYGHPSYLIRNDGDGQWTSTSLGNLRAFSAMFADYDNDGDLDLFVAGGHASPEPGRLYANNGDGTFTLVTQGVLYEDRRRSATCAWADFDNDGFMDLTVTGHHQDSPDVLYRNQGNANRWISVRLVGTGSNRAAIGAKVRARATVFGKTTWQLRELGGGNRSQNDLRAHFGLGDATEVEVLRIEWPSGIVQELSNLPANEFLTVTEPPRLRPLASNGFQIQCWLNQSFDIQASTDLAAWTHVTTLTNETGTLEFHDPDTSNHDCRYYRVMSR